MNNALQRALEDAAWDGDVLLVAHLINHPEVAPAADHSTALLHAAHRGHRSCIDLLLPVSDPTARRSEALWRAAKHRHRRCVRVLARFSDVGAWETWQWEEIPAEMRDLVRWCSNVPG